MSPSSQVGGIAWMLKWMAIVLALTFASHELYALWPYPQGVARGEVALRRNLEAEWDVLARIGGERYVQLAARVHDALYLAFFRAAGLDRFVELSADPQSPPLPGTGEMARRFVLVTRDAWQTAATGLQLFSARLAVLLLAAPLVLLTATGAFADGLVVWYLRRTGGGRESGFLYHRAKRFAGGSLVVLCLVYLVPPVALDPRAVLPPFLLAFAVSVRYAAAYFKKYL